MKEAIMAIVIGVLNIVTIAVSIFVGDTRVAEFLGTITPYVTTVVAAILAVLGVQGVQRRKAL